MMAGPKRKPAAKKVKKRASKKAARKTSPKKQAPRDVQVAPTYQQVERSIKLGKTRALAEFRKTIEWL